MTASSGAFSCKFKACQQVYDIKSAREEEEATTTDWRIEVSSTCLVWFLANIVITYLIFSKGSSFYFTFTLREWLEVLDN